MATIDNNYPDIYAKMFKEALQQTDSRIRKHTTDASFTGVNKYFQIAGKRDAQLVGARLQNTRVQEGDYERVWLTHDILDDVVYFDERDKFFLGDITRPDAIEFKNGVAAMNRKIDEYIINAALGNRVTGNTGGTSTALPGSQTIAVDYVPSGVTTNSGLTLAKIHKGIELLNEAEVPEEDRILVVSSKQWTDLRRIAETRSKDFTISYNAVTGKFDPIEGVEIVRCEKLPAEYDVRSCILTQKDMIYHSLGNVEVHVDVRPDKNHATAMRTVFYTGAMRFYQEGVVEILCQQ